MGCYKPCFSTSIETGSREIVVLELYDEAEARTVSATNPGFDDLLEEPFLEDDLIVIVDDEGIGKRVRPSTIVSVKARVEVSRYEEQEQDGTGNAPRSLIKLVISEEALQALTPSLLVAGIPGIRPNDRVLRFENASGAVRADFTASGRPGLYVYEVRPGDTGEGLWEVLVESRQETAR